MGRPRNSLRLDGAKVKSIREGLDLTQEAFVALNGVELSLSAFQRIERGEPASRDHAYQIAQNLNVDLDQLLLRISDKPVSESHNEKHTLASLERAILGVVNNPITDRWIRAIFQFIKRMWK